MILYKCDLCRKVSEKKTEGLIIGKPNGLTKDMYDICEECSDKIKNIVEGKISEDVWTNIHNLICNSSDDVYRGQE